MVFPAITMDPHPPRPFNTRGDTIPLSVDKGSISGLPQVFVHPVSSISFLLKRALNSKHQSPVLRDEGRGFGIRISDLLIAMLKRHTHWLSFYHFLSSPHRLSSFDARSFETQKENPKKTALMDYREKKLKEKGKKYRMDQSWVPFSKISPYLIKAVLIAEDDKFWEHEGFDYEAIQKAIERIPKLRDLSPAGVPLPNSWQEIFFFLLKSR